MICLFVQNAKSKVKRVADLEDKHQHNKVYSFTHTKTHTQTDSQTQEQQLFDIETL